MRPPSWQAITVRHLLTHTSGIPDYSRARSTTARTTPRTSWRASPTGCTLEFPPGSRWNYSNTGYVLLGIIVNRVSGTFYGDVLRERVFKPLGMTTARIISEADIVPNRAAGYRLVKGELKNQEWVSPSLNTTADGSLYFSVRDMIAWDAAVQARAMLKPESWAGILTPCGSTAAPPSRMALGGGSRSAVASRCISTAGGGRASRRSSRRFLGDSLSIIVLTNSGTENPGRFADGIAALINPHWPCRSSSPLRTASLRSPRGWRRCWSRRVRERSSRLTSPMCARGSSRSARRRIRSGCSPGAPGEDGAGPEDRAGG